MTEFLDGVAFAGFTAVAVWFVRAWLASRDRLMLAFAVAFTIFAFNRLLLAATERADESQTLIYLLRAAGFAVIIGAIMDRNRAPKTGRSGS